MYPEIEVTILASRGFPERVVKVWQVTPEWGYWLSSERRGKKYYSCIHIPTGCFTHHFMLGNTKRDCIRLCIAAEGLHIGQLEKHWKETHDETYRRVVVDLCREVLYRAYSEHAFYHAPGY